MTAHGFMAFFLEPPMAAELDPRAARGFCVRKAGPLQIVGTVLNMGTELVLHLSINPGTMKELERKRAKVGKEFHISSNCAARKQARSGMAPS
jgi:hypothetical protein